MAQIIAFHWHPALRPDSHASQSTEEEHAVGADEHEHEPEEVVVHEDSLHSDGISVTRGIEQHVEVASALPDSPEVQSEIVADATGLVSRRASWAQTAEESSAAQVEEGEEFDEEAAVFAPEGTYHEQEANLGDVEESNHNSLPSLRTAKPASEELHTVDSAGYDYQGEVSQMEEAAEVAPDAPLLLDEEMLPTVEEIKPDIPEDDSFLEEFDGAPAPGQPLPKAQAAPGYLDRSFTTNFTDMPQQETAAAQDETRQHNSQLSEGWPSIGDDRTFGELLGDDGPAETSQDAVEQEAQAQKDSIDDGWGAAGEDDAFGQLQSQSQPVDDVWGASGEETRALGDRQEEQQETQSADDVWGASGDNDEFTALAGNEISSQPEDVTNADAPVQKTEEDLAAMWQAALDDDELLDESNDLDPSTFFGDDDDGFLLDDEDEVLTSTPAAKAQSAPTQPQRSATNPYIPSQPTPAQPQRSITNSYIPANAPAQSPAQVNPYAPTSHQQLMGETIGRSGGTPSTGLFDVYGHGQQTQPQASQRPSAVTAQSFAGKSKGGYESPYDLPMDVVKQPRQRPRQPQPVADAPTPPPRSTSMSSQSGAGMAPPSSVSTPAAPPPTTSKPATPNTNSGFFEDLPVAPKPRARPSGAYTPQPQVAPTPPPGQTAASQLPSRGHMAPPAQPPQRPTVPPNPAQQSAYGGFQKPDRLPLLPDQSTAPHSQPNQMQPPALPSQSHRYSPSLPTTASTQNRFSPAPPAQAPPAAASRYSPAPGALQKRYSSGPAPAHTPPGLQQGHPFAPRTSSPLAYHTDKQHPPLPNELQRNLASMPSSIPSMTPSSPPPTGNGSRASTSLSPERKVGNTYSPMDQRTPSSHLASPPARPKTQSPPAVMKQAKYNMPTTERPTTAASVPKVTLSHRRQFSRDLPFVEPNDERIHDPLQRWKGQPIFKWSSSGSVVSSLPKQTPFYAAGHGIPSIKCTPGDISIQTATTFLPMDDRNAKFPGPLTSKAKGKKKDILAWMTGKIEDLERGAEAVRMDFNMDPDLKKRVEEKLVLWKIVRIFVENDGSLEGSPKIEEQVRPVLLPNLAEMAQVMDQHSSTAVPDAQTDPVDKTVVVQIRQALLEGQRERAVWLAEEKKLWGHAMLISSTMGPETWKQIIQSFVRSEVKTVGSDARSLAALYQVFGGNAEECVDELVPPSARAGFKMVSKSAGVATGNPLEGLDQWRETLGLVAGNRTPNDAQSLLALGKLLSGYGRAEASHTCFLFARHVAKHSGADDAEASFVLLGADHADGSFANDIDAIILTEIYEWASSLSATNGTYIPHLQSFKLIHAQELAAHGLTNKALLYCDHITTAFSSAKFPSPYYHPVFTQSVTDLNAFLSQSPLAGAQGLLNKKTMNKVYSGGASWFTKFVSGDDGGDDAGTQGTSGGGQDDTTPFGRVNGDSPTTLSRSASSTELYAPMMGGGMNMPFTGQVHGVSTPSAFQQPTSYMPSNAAQGKYAPVAGGSAAGGNKYAPAGSATSLGLPAEIHPRPASTRSARSYTPAPAAAAAASTGTQPSAVPGPGRPGANRAVTYSAESRKGSVQYGSSQGSYQPSPMLAAQDAGTTYGAGGYGYQSQGTPSSEGGQGSYGYRPQSQPSSETAQGSYGYQPHGPSPQQPVEEEEEEEDEGEDPFARPPQSRNFEASPTDDPEGGSYEPSTPSFGYEPPSAGSGGKAPPSMSNGVHEPPSTTADDERPSSGYEPPSDSGGGYEPPSYEPPSYQPYDPDAEASPEEPNSKPKKSIMDDDDDADDLAARAAALKKAAADKAADDAFRKAAEADAARDNKKHSNNQSLGGGGDKKGWFGGWFKKDPNAAAQGNGPIRAKLGEENSFYFDEDLKKWVNKKGGGDESATASAATPPPPRASGPPSRTVSGAIGSAGGPPSGPPSRIVSSAALPGSGPPSRIGTPADGSSAAAPPLSAVPGGMNGGGSGPPSRPGTGMSNASSLDDLLAGTSGGQRKAGGTVKKKKSGRYVDVMAK